MAECLPTVQVVAPDGRTITVNESDLADFLARGCRLPGAPEPEEQADAGAGEQGDAAGAEDGQGGEASGAGDGPKNKRRGFRKA